jgi:hypothetical protein
MNKFAKILLILIILSSACSKYNNSEITFHEPLTAIYIGDSLCAEPFLGFDNAATLAGIDSDCKFGRISIEYSDLPDYDIIFYALGTNDAWWPVDVADYESDLAKKINKVEGIVYCVLPMYLEDRDTQPYRTAMVNVCTDVIDPAEYGVVVLGEGDGLHWDQADQECMSLAILERIDP